MQEIVERYIAAWNEKDAQRRRELVEALWAPDGRYTDPLADARGPEEIAGLIGAVQQQFPDFTFTLGGAEFSCPRLSRARVRSGGGRRSRPPPGRARRRR